MAFARGNGFEYSLDGKNGAGYCSETHMSTRGFTAELVSSKAQDHFTVAFTVLEVSDLFHLVTQLELLMIHWGVSDFLISFHPPMSSALARPCLPMRSLPQLPSSSAYVGSHTCMCAHIYPVTFTTSPFQLPLLCPPLEVRSRLA